MSTSIYERDEADFILTSIYMHLSIKSKRVLFPTSDVSDKIVDKLIVTPQGAYSISHPAHADFVSHLIRAVMLSRRDRAMRSISVVDATANIGGNTISFARHGFATTSIEIDPVEFAALKNNTSILCKQQPRLICADACEALRHLSGDVLFIDPPWGGIDYKNKSIEYKMGEMPLIKFLEIYGHKFKMVIIKAPTGVAYKRRFNYEITVVPTPRGTPYKILVYTDVPCHLKKTVVKIPYTSYKMLR